MIPLTLLLTFLGLLSLLDAKKHHPANEAGRGLRSTPRIVGGIEVPSPDNFSFFVSLHTTGQTVAYCGGSLIAPNIVLTAAHCVETTTDANFYVSIGRYNLTDADETGVITREVAEVINHVCYDQFNTNYDVAIVKLVEPVIVDLNDAAGPRIVAIDSGTPQILFSADPATMLTVIGFGDTLVEDPVTGSAFPDVKRQVDVPFISNAECAEKNGLDLISDAMLCAAFDEGGKDACQGDSGGPLFLNSDPSDPSKIVLVGVVSWGFGCAVPDQPGVYASVAALHDWIQGYVDGNDMNQIEEDKGDLKCPLALDRQDCDGNLVTFNAASALFGDGTCNGAESIPIGPNLNCTAFSFDDGDCPIPNGVDCFGTSFTLPLIVEYTGDDFCDGVDLPYGMNLNCLEYSFDGGDCDSELAASSAPSISQAPSSAPSSMLSSAPSVSSAPSISFAPTTIEESDSSAARVEVVFGVAACVVASSVVLAMF